MPYIEKDAVNRVFLDELGKIPSVVIAERIEWNAAREAIIRCASGVSTIPTADVVERKRGKWKNGYCLECGYNWGKYAPIASAPNFCPNCGAQMIERKKDE